MISTKILGDFGELLVAKRLESKGHKILRTRYKKWEGEIDIVSTKDGVVYFNEVKTRVVKKVKDETDLQNIGLTRHKMSKIIKCAQWFSQKEIGKYAYAKRQFDAYFLQLVPDNMRDVSTLDDLKHCFTEGKMRVLSTYMENIDMEIFGCYTNTLID